jgi:hypothetical protein
MDALAVVYSRELARWGIETSIIVPGAFTGGTNHFAHAGSPDDKARAAEYEASPYAGFGDQVLKGFASIVPAEADVSAVAEAIVRVVDAPFGKRPFRVHIDPTQDGSEVVNGVMDRVRAELLRRIGLGDLLTPRVVAFTVAQRRLVSRSRRAASISWAAVTGVLFIPLLLKGLRIRI